MFVNDNGCRSLNTEMLLTPFSSPLNSLLFHQRQTFCIDHGNHCGLREVQLPGRRTNGLATSRQCSANHKSSFNRYNNCSHSNSVIPLRAWMPYL